MKNLFKALIVVMIPLLLASCGGGDKAGKIVGKWKADVSSLDLVLGDGVPAEIKTMVEGQKDKTLGEAEKEVSDITIEFTEAGKVVLSKEGEDEKPEMDYSVSGNKLNLKGDVEGQEVDFTLTLASVSGDKMTVAITGEEIVKQMKEKYAKEFEQANGMAAAFAQGASLEDMLKGSKVSLSFKK
jgi:hypothetical protein